MNGERNERREGHIKQDYIVHVIRDGLFGEERMGDAGSVGCAHVLVTVKRCARDRPKSVRLMVAK